MLTAKLTLSLVAAQTSALDLTTPEADLTKSYVESYSDGVGIDQAQKLFTDTRTVAGSGTDNLDLSGVLVDALGNTLALTGVKEIVIKNKSLVNALRFGKKISNGFAGPFDQTAGSLGVRVEPNAVQRFSNPSASGWLVTAATADILSVENLGGTSADYDIVIIGI